MNRGAAEERENLIPEGLDGRRGMWEEARADAKEAGAACDALRDQRYF